MLMANFLLETDNETTIIAYGLHPHDYVRSRPGYKLTHGLPVYIEGVWMNVEVWHGAPTPAEAYDKRQFEPKRSAIQWIDLLLIVREQSGGNLWPPRQ